MARDGSFSCRASALRIGPIEPVKAGDNLQTLDNPTDASDPCRPETAGLASYGGPVGCYLVRSDPNCFNPNAVAVGLLYATTEECRPNTADPTQLPNPGPGDFCRSTPGAVDLQGKNAEPVMDGDGVKARAGAADLFITDEGKPVPNFLHVSAVNSFAEVACRTNSAATLPSGAPDPNHNPNYPVGQRIPVWDARSQVVYVNGQLGPLGVGLDIIPGLIPNASPTEPTLNMYGELGPIRFNATYINNNEPGGIAGPDEGMPRKPNPATGSLDLNGDAEPQTPGFQPVFRVVQRAVDIAGAVVAGEAVVDVTKNPCGPSQPPVKGNLIVKKDVPPADKTDSTAFHFTVNPGNQQFSLTDGNQAATQVAPGTYTITETANANYTTTSSCSDPTNNSAAGGSTATAVIDGTETVTCTFTNTPKCTHNCGPTECKPPKVIKDGKCVDPHKPPHCDRNGDGKDDRDKNGDGRDDKNGKHLRRNMSKDDCPHGKKPKCSKHSKKSKKSSNKDDKGDKDDDHGKKKGDKDDDHGKKKGDKDDDDDKGKKKGDKDDDDHGKCEKKSKKSKKAKRSKKG